MLSTNKKTRDTAQDFIAKCVAVGRSCGVHMVLCTQVISKVVLTLLVQGNTPGKMVFKQANRTASINALGDGRAWTHIEQPGMGYFCDERGNEMLVQTPLIYEFQRDELIERERARIEGRLEQPREICIGDVIEYARANHGGKMADRDMWAEFKGRVSLPRLRELIQAHHEKRFFDGPREYTIIPGSGKRAARFTCVSLVHVRSAGEMPSNGRYSEMAKIEEKNEAVIIEIPGQPAETAEVERDPLYEDAVHITQGGRKLSVSLLQRRLRIPYTRAARLLDQIRGTIEEVRVDDVAN